MTGNVPLPEITLRSLSVVSADRVVAGAVADEDAVQRVAQRGVTARIRADLVAGDDVVAVVGLEVDPGGILIDPIARDHVADDAVARGIVQEDAVEGIAPAHRTGGVGADEVADDQVIVRAGVEDEASAWKPSMTRPWTVFPPEFSVSPSPTKPAAGVISITGWVMLAPGWDCWLKPAMKTECWTPPEEGLAIVRPASNRDRPRPDRAIVARVGGRNLEGDDVVVGSRLRWPPGWRTGASPAPSR